MSRVLTASWMAAAASLVVTSLPLTAQTGPERVADEIVVTGSYIRRQEQADLPSPLTTVGAGDIQDIGAQNIADITQTLTINTGAQNNPDAFTQNATTGTSNINLRGLGVGSTLVLLNGRRQVLSAQPTNDGVNFIDTASLVPLIAVDRVEILKDGASALYGSDAVAGVVNFITRSGYDGAALSAEWTSHQSDGNYEGLNLQALFGRKFDRGDVMLAASFLDNSALTTAERRLSRPQDDTSALGNPGAFFGNSDAPDPALPTIDPGCAANGGFPLPASPAAAPLVEQGFGFCGFDFGDFFNLVPEQERLTAFAQGNMQLGDRLLGKFEVGYADNSAVRGNSPTFPFLRLDRAVVPSFHPNTIFPDDNVAFFGRASGNGGEISPNFTDSESLRISAALNGNFSRGFWEVAVTHAENDFTVRTEDTVTDRFACALSGFGASPEFNQAIGLDCSSANPALTANGASIPATGTFFNPFASSFDTAPNPPGLLDYVTEFQTRALESTLDVIDAVVSMDVGRLDAGPIGIALGLQFRDNDLKAGFDSLSVSDGFAFLVGEQPYSGNQDVIAGFAEMALPLARTLDLQLALRHEDYGSGQGGSTTDPKVALLYRPSDALSLRGSFSTSFRAPSVFQQLGQGTTLQQVTDPLNATAFVAVRQSGNPDLKPEESEAFNLGGSFSPLAGLSIDLDFFHFDFSNVVVPENPQAILNADPSDPRVVRAPSDDGSGTILQINTGFVNASSVRTSGLDLGVRWSLNSRAMGRFEPTLNGTYLLDYELEDPQAGKVDGAGLRNFTNFGTSAPELRLNAGLLWSRAVHSANLFIRYIDSYEDDQPAGANARIDSDTRVDLQYALDLGTVLDRHSPASLTVGLRNATDETAPFVATNGGFDSKVADPRGRLAYLGVTLGF